MLNPNNYTLLWQVVHIPGRFRGPLAQIILVAHQAVECSIKINGNGTFREIKISSNLNEIVNRCWEWSEKKRSLKLCEETLEETKNGISSNLYKTGNPILSPDSMLDPTNGTIPTPFPIQKFPGTSIPLVQVLDGIIGVVIIATLGELLYENKSDEGWYCNIKQPPGVMIPAEPEFHIEYLIPAVLFSLRRREEEFFFETIQKKSKKTKIQIYNDLILYRTQIVKRLNQISNRGCRLVLWSPTYYLTRLVVNAGLHSFQQRYELLLGILTVSLSYYLVYITNTLLKQGIRMIIREIMELTVVVYKVTVVVYKILLKTYQFLQNGILWLFVVSQQKIIWILKFIKKNDSDENKTSYPEL